MQVKEDQEKSKELLDGYQSELDKVSGEIERLESEAENGSEKGELSLGAKQCAEYNQLKAQAGAATSTITDQINAKERELKGLKPFTNLGRRPP